MGLKIAAHSSIVVGDEIGDEQGKGEDDGFDCDGAPADRRASMVGFRSEMMMGPPTLARHLLLSLEETEDAPCIRCYYRSKMVETGCG
ncbi:hypothetical protein ACLOJK_014938 [Asimina triloba]